jgi:hypothetical protein
VGAIPTWQVLLQPVAIGAVAEVTKLPKPLMKRVAWRPREQAGRNVSERRAGLEMIDAGADPADIWGRPPSSLSGEQPDPRDDPAGVVATACQHKENGRNTGNPSDGRIASQLASREGQARSCGVADRLVVPMKPGNAGGGKGPDFGSVLEGIKSRESGLRV